MDTKLQSFQKPAKLFVLKKPFIFIFSLQSNEKREHFPNTMLKSDLV
jgi:hypothetical protein